MGASGGLRPSTVASRTPFGVIHRFGGYQPFAGGFRKGPPAFGFSLRPKANPFKVVHFRPIVSYV